MTAAERRDARWSRVRFRVTATAASVGVLGSVVGSVLFVTGLHASLERSLVTSAQQQTRSIIAQLDQGAPVEQTTVTDKDDIIVQVVAPSGEVLASDHPALSGAIRTTSGTSTGVAVAGLPDTFAVHAEATSDGRLVVVGLAEEQVVRATRTAMFLLALAVPVGIGLLAIGVRLSVDRALRPVEEMRRQAASISSDQVPEHSSDRLVVPPGDDEIPLLASTLNEMLERIDLISQRQRQFVADASHELRTPLATMRQTAELAQRHPDATTVQALASAVLDAELRMENLVQALLTLARLDDRQSDANSMVDLDDAVLREIDQLRTQHPELLVDRSGVSAGQVRGDAVLLGQVVSNLLSNAARHARTTVRVVLTQRGGCVVLAVEDDGSGVPASDRQRVLQRFTRLDEARTRDSGGLGLGLAIVSKVVQTAHGTLTIEESELGGARFVVSFPGAE